MMCIYLHSDTNQSYSHLPLWSRFSCIIDNGSDYAPNDCDHKRQKVQNYSGWEIKRWDSWSKWSSQPERIIDRRQNDQWWAMVNRKRNWRRNAFFTVVQNLDYSLGEKRTSTEVNLQFFLLYTQGQIMGANPFSRISSSRYSDYLETMKGH